MQAVETAPNHPSRPTIVVGVDASLSARIALEHAVLRARPDGRLLVATVVAPLSDALVRAAGALRDERRAAAQRLVDRLAAEVAIETETRVLEGAPAEQLAQLARESDADEIVVGSRGTGRLAAALGSVSHALLAHADHPVVVVPRAVADHPGAGHTHGDGTVVVGYDGSPPSQAAIDYAAARAAEGGRVVAVHAFQPVPDWVGTPRYQEALDAHQEHGRELLRSLDERRDVGAELTTSLLEGPAAMAIVAAADARDADEIVIGSRGFGRIRGILGSVSHALLHEADRPVVVIPSDAVRDPRDDAQSCRAALA
jgi:nucleotide-binding universal stress UspA family protein